MRPVERRSPTASILLPLDPGSGKPLHRQIASGLRRAILSGAVAPGTRIPSSRGLAKDLGVSRTTVLLGFEPLLAEGYLVTRRASATSVPAELPGDFLLARVRPTRSPRKLAHPPLSMRGRALAGTPSGGRRLAPAPRAFRPGTPALDLFPSALWARLSARRRRNASASLLDYGDPRGHLPLREAIAAHVSSARGTRCSAEQVFVLPGAQAALELAARMLLDPGDAAWLEDPGYPGARSALTAAGAAIVPVPVDRNGLDVAAAERLGPRARLAYVTPSHQYPLGVALSLSRRLALLAWASRAGSWIVEDDYDSEFRYAGRPLPSLHGLDADGRVLYAGTFSKTLFPGLRLGFLIVPEDLVGPFTSARDAANSSASSLEQATLADFLAEGHFARHLRRMRSVYAERLEAIQAAAPRECGSLLRLRDTDTGMHVVGDLPEGVDDRRVAAAAAERGVEVSPLSLYRAGRDRPRSGGLVLGFAATDRTETDRAMAVLASAIRGTAHRAGAKG